MSTVQLEEGVQTFVAGFGGSSSYTAKIFGLSSGGYVVTVRQATSYSQGLIYLFDSDRNFVSQYAFSAFRAFIDQGAETSNGYVVGVTDYGGANGVILPGDVYMYRFSQTGSVLGQPVLVNDVRDQQGQNSVADRNVDFTTLTSGKILAAWTAGGDIAVKVFENSGVATSPQRVANTTGSGLQDNAHLAALANGNAVVAWDGGPSGARYVRAQVLSSTGEKVGAELVFGSQLSYVVEVLATSQGFNVFWLSDNRLYFQAFDGTGSKIGGERTVALSASAAVVRSVSSNGTDGFVVSWVHTSNASMTQVFDRNGAAISDLLQPMAVDPAAPLSQVFAIQLSDGSIETIGTTSVGSIVRTELLLGGRPADLTGTNAVDYIEGDERNNVLRGGDGADYLYGLSGDDILIGGFGADYLNGGLGNDTADFSDSTVGVTANLISATGNGASGQDRLVSIENLMGSSFADTLTGDDNPNRLNGGPGDDLIITGKGGDTVIGGLGLDTVDYRDSNGTVLVNLTLQRGYNNYADGDTYEGIENATGSYFNDLLIGDEGVNRLNGSFGNDTLIGALGADILDGGPDTDTADYSDSIGTVFINLTLGRGYNNSAEGDTYVSIENVSGSRFADFFIGDEKANRFEGQAGNDTFIGAMGADILIGGDGSDTASYEDNQGGVFVNLASGRGFNNAADGDIYESIENATGSIFADYIIGDSAANRLDGNAGDDILIGGLGADTLVGGAGFDTASYEDNWGAVFVNLVTGQGASNAAQGDSFESIEGLVGSVFYDTFIGSNERNVLNGKRGADTLTGNGGNDDFVFDTPLDGQINVDHITDFTSGQDRIVLDRSVFFTLSAGALQANNLFFGTEATGGQNRIIYDQQTGRLWFDDDGNGSDPAILFAVLDNQPALASTDFIVV